MSDLRMFTPFLLPLIAKLNRVGGSDQSVEG